MAQNCDVCGKKVSYPNVVEYKQQTLCRICLEKIKSKDESEETPEDMISKRIPKKKRNIGCGIILIILSLGALRSTCQGAQGPDDIAWMIGGLAAFGTFVYFGIRMIIGKEIKENNEKHD